MTYSASTRHVPSVALFSVEQLAKLGAAVGPAAFLREPVVCLDHRAVVLLVEGLVGIDALERAQYSFLRTKKDPRIVPASFDFCLANLNRDASSAGTSMPSESLNPTARFPPSSTVYITLIDRPFS